MEASAIIVPTQLAYVHIPANELRSFVDRLFPGLAHCSVADVSSGFGHRYMKGHDLLLDVPRTLYEYGPLGGLKHAGHVLLTDFPTKAGIPIPGFSHSGLGQLLEHAGIHRGWLQVNLCDTGLGIIAIAEGTSNLLQALSGSLLMNGGTFFDTFVEGSIEIALSVLWPNPILLAGGLENIAAGIIATWNTFSIYVDPLAFFGSAGTSAIIGFALAYGLAGDGLDDATRDAVRSGIVGGLFTLSPAFGFGAIAGFASFKLGESLASVHNSSQSALLKIDDNAYQLLLAELCGGNVDLTEFLNRAELKVVLLDSSTALLAESTVLDQKAKMLPQEYISLESNKFTLPQDSSQIKTAVKRLPEDAIILSELYSAALLARSNSINT